MTIGKQNPDFDLSALQTGDRAEFALFVEAYSGQVYRLALKMLQNPQDAEDILQETFIKAYKALPKFEGRSSLSTWLYRIATNEALMFLRKKRPAQVSVDEPLENDDGGVPTSTYWMRLVWEEIDAIPAMNNNHTNMFMSCDASRVDFCFC